jgi:hypothetical protein
MAHFRCRLFYVYVYLVKRKAVPFLKELGTVAWGMLYGGVNA